MIDAEYISKFDQDSFVYLRDQDGTPYGFGGEEPVPYAELVSVNASELTRGDDRRYHQTVRFTLKFNNPNGLFFPLGSQDRLPRCDFAPMMTNATITWASLNFSKQDGILYTLEGGCR